VKLGCVEFTRDPTPSGFGGCQDPPIGVPSTWKYTDRCITEENATTSLAGQTVLVTGANRGMGREYVSQLLGRGVTKVYAAAPTHGRSTSRSRG
jgi:hypothetical protein